MTSHRDHFVETNGIRLHVSEEGAGPLVLLCHGFPETSYAWHKQLPALAAAGFRAVAPDLRGFGASDRPQGVESYSTFDVVGDLVGLLDALGEKDAVIVGNDWGSTVAWQAAQMRPDRFRAVAALGVPMMDRSPEPPSKLFPQTDEAWFYTHYFAKTGLAERELERDVATTLRKIFYAASGDIGPRDANSPNPFGLIPRKAGLLDGLPEPARLPDWLSPSDLDVFVKAFQSSGFRGALNYYRNLDRNWQLQAALAGLKVTIPALYLVGERDTGLAIPGMPDVIGAMPKLVPDLRDSQVIPRAGHWLQQEASDTVNAVLVGFLRAL